MKRLSRLLARIPVLSRLLRSGRHTGPFRSQAYWVARYRVGGTSGGGSEGVLARFKSDVVNGFVADRGIRSVVEYGCGDGGQLRLADYPRYVGFDVSADAIARCREHFAGDHTKRFALMQEYAGERADLTLSLDVIYHLVEDEVFEEYMARVFDSADRFVIVYSSDSDHNSPEQAPHVRHRRFTDWVRGSRPGWVLQERIPNPHPYQGSTETGSAADFYIFERMEEATA